MAKALGLLILVLAFFLAACAAPETVRVERVIDGDTIVIEGGERVRYIGIDTPELSPAPEHYAEEARQRNVELVAGKQVRLERDISDRDRYGRLLRYVYVDEVFVNAALVQEGYARARDYPPDSKRSIYFARLEREAKRDGRGMWAKQNTKIGQPAMVALSLVP